MKVPTGLSRGSEDGIAMEFLAQGGHEQSVPVQLLSRGKSTVGTAVRPDGRPVVIKVPDPGAATSTIAHYEALAEACNPAAPAWYPHPVVAPDAVILNGERRTAIVIPYVEGVDLRDWLARNRFDAERTRTLTERVVGLLADLDEWGGKHGDLLPENIVVTPDDQVRVIDFDRLQVPAGWHETDASEPGDRVAGWLLVLSMLTLAAFPNLWRLAADDGLLLSSGELRDGESAGRFRQLGDLPHPIAGEWSAIAGFAALPDDLVPPVSEEWPALQGISQAEVPVEQSLVRFQERPLLGRVVLGVGVASAVLAIGYSVGLSLALLVASLAVVVALAGRQPEMQARQEQLRQVTESRRLAAEQRQRLAAAEGAARSGAAEIQQLQGGHQQRLQQIHQHYTYYFGTERRRLEREITAIEDRLRQSEAELSRAQRDCSARTARAHYENFRTAAAIPPLPGIGQGMLATLRAAGFSNAASIQDIRIFDTPSGRRVGIQHAAGDWRYVPGLGPAKGAALLGWVRAVEAAAQQSTPAPTAAELDQVARQHRAAMAELRQREAALRDQLAENARSRQEEIDRAEAQALSERDAELGRLQQRAASADSALAEAQAEAALAAGMLNREEQQLARYQRISTWGFLRSCVTAARL